MRVSASGAGLTVRAIAGTHVVLFGMNLPAASVSDLRGFSIKRAGPSGKPRWLPNQVVFEINDQGLKTNWSSLQNPIQTFRWGDYTVRPGTTYTYTVRARGGVPGALTTLAEVELTVTTEPVDQGTHRIYFNRGAISSQWYAEQYGNAQPADVPDHAAYRWLSRGLEEALLGFIGQANDSSWSLHAALYETTWPPALQAFAAASTAGADVKLVVDMVGGPNRDPRKGNEPALTAAGLDPLVTRRTKIGIAHNKFIVASHNDQAVAVWTGSTNITEGGLFGQLNVGHGIYDTGIAASYLAYWQQLATDPTRPELKAWNDQSVQVGGPSPSVGVTTVFSPRGDLAALNWYTQLAEQATSGVFPTAAFGVGPELLKAFTQDKPYLRYILMDNDDGKILLQIRDADPDNRITVGAPIGKGGWRQWVKETTLEVNKHVRYIHTKFMLVDPLTDHPLVITGSANFSKNSTIGNDENMVLISGDHDVVDTYLTEFMRTFTHFEFRAKTKTPRKGAAPGPQALGELPKRKFFHLDLGSAWAKRWYEPGSARAQERSMFSGVNR